ncbi:hypothetical protein M9458_051784, partial [Cirrhinus mrigala]
CVRFEAALRRKMRFSKSKFHKNYRAQTALHALYSLLRYFNVIHRSVCAAQLIAARTLHN